MRDQLGLFEAPAPTSPPEVVPVDPGPMAFGKMAGKSQRKIDGVVATMKSARRLADEYYARWGRPEEA